MSNLNKWLAGIFVLLILVIVIVISSITYAIRRDCNQPYYRHLKLGGYWLTVRAGSNEIGCIEQE